MTERIISCALEVHSTLGPSLLEGVHEEALAQEVNNLEGPERRKQKFP
ncbi:MAG: GxxExxY protein [Thermodesulfobacteriota bacterium]